MFSKIFLVSFLIFGFQMGCEGNANITDDVMNQTSNRILIEIEFEGVNYQTDLIDFIEENKKNVSVLDIREKAIMVLGLSGAGKSTLVNYLNLNKQKMFAQIMF